MARNARFVLNASHVTLVATGRVAAATDWSVDVPQGAPRVQRRDPDTGLPVWLVDCLDESDDTAARASVVGVEVVSETEPTPQKYRPLDLQAVSVSLYINKANQLAVSYTAELKVAPVRAANAA